MKTISTLLVAVSCTLSAAPAYAEQGYGPVTVTGTRSVDPDDIRIPYGDLRLANEADADELRARVRRAARQACDAYYDGAMLSRNWACQDATWNAARPQIAAAIERASAPPDLANQTIVLRFARR